MRTAHNCHCNPDTEPSRHFQKRSPNPLQPVGSLLPRHPTRTSLLSVRVSLSSLEYHGEGVPQPRVSFVSFSLRVMPVRFTQVAECGGSLLPFIAGSHPLCGSSAVFLHSPVSGPLGCSGLGLLTCKEMMNPHTCDLLGVVCCCFLGTSLGVGVQVLCGKCGLTSCKPSQTIFHPHRLAFPPTVHEHSSAPPPCPCQHLVMSLFESC